MKNTYWIEWVGAVPTLGSVVHVANALGRRRAVVVGSAPGRVLVAVASRE